MVDKSVKAAGFKHPEFDEVAKNIDIVNYEIAAADARFNAEMGISHAPVPIEGADDMFVIALPLEMMRTMSVEEIEEYVNAHFKPKRS